MALVVMSSFEELISRRFSDGEIILIFGAILGFLATVIGALIAGTLALLNQVIANRHDRKVVLGERHADMKRVTFMKALAFLKESDLELKRRFEYWESPEPTKEAHDRRWKDSDWALSPDLQIILDEMKLISDVETFRTFFLYVHNSEQLFKGLISGEAQPDNWVKFHRERDGDREWLIALMRKELGLEMDSEWLEEVGYESGFKRRTLG